MSFSSETRKELCRIQTGKNCCRRAECYGILLCCKTCMPNEIRITTENPDFALRIIKLFKSAFGVMFDQMPESVPGGKQTFVMSDAEKIRRILRCFDLDHSAGMYINYGVLEQECCRRSFLRGAFLAGGSITDPGKRYHLEIATTHRGIGAQIQALMRELDFSFRLTRRGGGEIVYLKQSDSIVDFLTTIGAPLSAMKFIQIKMEKDLRNEVNRKCNCDTANLSKSVEASVGQIRAIRKLRESGEFDSLPKKLQDTARLREENPEATLQELAELSDPPLSKPAVSHRLRRLVELSEQQQKETADARRTGVL